MSDIAPSADDGWDWFAGLVRGGFAARAIVYGMIGALALALALGSGSGRATNQQGALALISQAPLGGVALGFLAIGLAAYAAWKAIQAVAGRGPEGGGGERLLDRVSNAGAAVSYAGFCAVAVSVLVGRGGSGSPSGPAAGVLGWPGGRLIVGAAGVILIVICAVQIHDALTNKFLEQIKRMPERQRRAAELLGRIGIPARALVFALIGWFLVRTAIDYQASKAVGVDGALRALERQSYGRWLLGLVAVGLLVFAAYSLVEARYRRL